MEENPLKLLNIFTNNVRVKIIGLLLEFEWRSLSDMAKKLEKDYGWKITLPGLLKHMRELESAGIVRRESGVFAKVPDARKTIYILEGRERVEKILKNLKSIENPLLAGRVFAETARLARKIQGMGSTLITDEEKKRLESLVNRCESNETSKYLTEDEKKKVKLWRMMMTLMEK
ncbi:MAG: winged helix-turn-helix domain-containing protein [Candidatus Bathyarchaeota archaeon]|nr:winged helix-turn-helix domain-containing protein [Candidatus Bathyarchaeota archaeon]